MIKDKKTSQILLTFCLLGLPIAFYMNNMKFLVVFGVMSLYWLIEYNHLILLDKIEEMK